MLLLFSVWVQEWVSERVSELENEWVFYVNQTAHAICRHSFRQSLDSFCFSLFVFRFSLFDHRSVSCCNCYLRTWIRECLSERVNELENEWVFYVNQTAHAICRRSFGQRQDSCFSFFAFRFSLFVFLIIGLLHAFYCLVSKYMSKWVYEWTSEWVRKWVSFLRQSNSSCHMPTFILSKCRFFLFFAFRFSFFAFQS